MTFRKSGSLWTPTRNIWVPSRKLADNRGFISPGIIGAVAGSRMRVAASVEVGYTAVGAGSETRNSDYIVGGGKFTAPSSGTITSIWLYSANNNSGLDVKVGVYVDSSGSPGAKVAGSPVEFLNMGTWSASWKEFSGLSFSITSGGVYWLMFIPSLNGSLTAYRDTAGSNSYAYKAATYANAWPDPYSKTGSNSTQWSIKATLTT